MYRFSLIIFLSLICPFISVGQHTNIFISQDNFPEETSIAIDPKNPAHIVGGANSDNVYISTDTGNTWTASHLTSTYGVGGDPMIITDTAGKFYYFHLRGFLNPNTIDRVVCQRLDNIGGSWTSGSYFMGMRMQDKPWAVTDPQTNNIYVTWTQFDNYGSMSPADSSIILFTRSTDQGNSWSAPVRLNTVAGDCEDSSKTVEGAVPCVGPNGEIYVAWAGANGILFDRSLDKGQSWLSNDIFVDNVGGPGWDYEIPGLIRCNGLPFIACDLSGGPYTGNIYINWSDQTNGTNNTDVWLARSTDGGNHWTGYIKVNTDILPAHQFMSSMTVDQATGYIYVLFYDRRNYTDNRTDVYLAVSKDGGQTFKDQKISQAPFTPYPTVFFGDYTHIAAYNNIIRPIWTRLDVPQLSVWTAKIDTQMLFTDISPISPIVDESELVYPNPFSGTAFISLKLRSEAPVSLYVTDVFGKKIATIKNNQLLPAGKYVFEFNARQYNIPSGVYYFILRSNSTIKTQKIILSE